MRRGIYDAVQRQMAGPCVPCCAAYQESRQMGRTTSLQHDGMLAQETTCCLVLQSVSFLKDVFHTFFFDQ